MRVLKIMPGCSVPSDFMLKDINGKSRFYTDAALAFEVGGTYTIEMLDRDMVLISRLDAEQRQLCTNLLASRIAYKVNGEILHRIHGPAVVVALDRLTGGYTDLSPAQYIHAADLAEVRI